LRVLVTGATGFIGSHTIAELSRHGHQVCAFTRDADRLEDVLAPFHVTPEVFVGDMTQPKSLRTAAIDCDAIIHTAATIDVAHSRRTATDENAIGTKTVLDVATDACVPRVVYLSSLAAYLPTDDDVIGPDTPLAAPSSGYGKSKRDAEQLVRRWQAVGGSATTLVPGAVYGPLSPHPERSLAAIIGALHTGMIVCNSIISVVDVRDLCGVISRCLQDTPGPRRYFVGGHSVTWAQWVEALSEAAGTRIISHVVADHELLEIGRQNDQLRSEGKPSRALSEEAAQILIAYKATDDSQTVKELGLDIRQLTATFRDCVAYLRSSGLVPDNI
jgi:dihydroflavonol-4-reductase